MYFELLKDGKDDIKLYGKDDLKYDSFCVQVSIIPSYIQFDSVILGRVVNSTCHYVQRELRG